jgi:hypothetical protein
MKHGVHIKEHKHWNTKTVYNHGHVMRINRRQPKTISFQSPMVNDFNQHLCGGWSMSDIKDEKEATIQQLMTGNKPFASITYWQDQKVKAEDAQRRIASAGLVTGLRKRAFPVGQYGHVWDLLACQDIRVNDIGDLRALRDDYAEVFEMGLENDEIMLFAERALSTFFDGWDSPPLPLWLTGIILGYPVENTISLYLEG